LNDEKLIISYLEEITTFFESYINDDRILLYIYFYVGIHLIKCKKFEWASLIFYKVKDISKHQKFHEVECSITYNLGLVNFAMKYFQEGIHNFENSLRLMTQYKTSFDFYLEILESLALANINLLKFTQSYNYIAEIIRMLSFKNDLESKIRINHFKTYLSFIIEVIQQMGTVLRMESKKLKKSVNRKINKDFEVECENLYSLIIESGFDRKQHLINLYTIDFLNLMKFLYNLTTEELSVFNEANKLDFSANTKEIKKDNNEVGVFNNNFGNSTINSGFSNFITHKNSNANFSNNPNSYLNNLSNYTKEFIAYIQEKKRLRAINIEYVQDMEVKKLYDCLPKTKQDIFKTLNLDLLRRHVILKDVKENIDHQNLNYHPIHTTNLMNLIIDIKSDNKISFLRFSLFKSENIGVMYFEGIQEEGFQSLYAFSKYINNPETQKKLLIFNSLTRANHNGTQKVSNKIPLQRSERIFSMNKNTNTNKLPFDYFYEQMIKIPEYKVIPNIKELLFEIYSQLEMQSYISYILDNPDILKSFLYADIAAGKISEENLGNYNKKQQTFNAFEHRYKNIINEYPEWNQFNNDLAKHNKHKIPEFIENNKDNKNEKEKYNRSFIDYIKEKKFNTLNIENLNEEKFRPDIKIKRNRGLSQKVHHNHKFNKEKNNEETNKNRTKSFFQITDKIDRLLPPKIIKQNKFKENSFEEINEDIFSKKDSEKNRNLESPSSKKNSQFISKNENVSLEQKSNKIKNNNDNDASLNIQNEISKSESPYKKRSNLLSNKNLPDSILNKNGSNRTKKLSSNEDILKINLVEK